MSERPDPVPDAPDAPDRLWARLRRRLPGRALAVGAGGLGLLGLVWLAGARAEAPRAAGPTPTPAATTPGGETTGAVPAAGAVGGASGSTGSATSSKVRVVFKTVPPTQATVNWGKKRLGIVKPKAPLVIERPRDSGPLDVVVHAEGCLPVHSRVYTFTDSVLAVKVTPLDKKNTIFGYKEAPPPDEDGGSPPAGDAGMP
jgi:hypothetical protein